MMIIANTLAVATLASLGQSLLSPAGLAEDPAGRLVVADRGAHYVLVVDRATGRLSPLAGTGVAGFSGDGGPATSARLRNPEWVVFDAAGNAFIADRGNHRVRRVDAATGTITTVAGNGAFASTGDGGPAVEAALTSPYGVAIDHAGNLFVFDTEAHKIRRVDRTTGIITTAVGTGEEGFGGDNGPGTSASLYRPHNGTFDSDGNLVFGDSFNQRIRRWTPGGRIVTIAGRGEQGSARDGVLAADAAFTFFGALAFDLEGNLVLTSLDNRVLRIDRTTARLAVVAGIGTAGMGGDGEPAREARFRTPYGLVIDRRGNLFVADAGNARIRRIDAETGVITTVAGGLE